MIRAKVNLWWIRGEDALILAFFRELYSATKPNLGDKAKELLPTINRFLKAWTYLDEHGD
ncbi:hypothetical protein [Sphingobium chlorophenolicum]|uniref:hypothetical protein n=1 Tax=Sphingobium chlorophenolicum TaxID=46429 RepID=UPI00059DB609|nr:hypothetical protein [Sphingobium chlorophenolicum]